MRIILFWCFSVYLKIFYRLCYNKKRQVIMQMTFRHSSAGGDSMSYNDLIMMILDIVVTSNVSIIIALLAVLLVIAYMFINLEYIVIV